MQIFLGDCCLRYGLRQLGQIATQTQFPAAFKDCRAYPSAPFPEARYHRPSDWAASGSFWECPEQESLQAAQVHPNTTAGKDSPDYRHLRLMSNCMVNGIYGTVKTGATGQLGKNLEGSVQLRCLNRWPDRFAWFPASAHRSQYISGLGVAGIIVSDRAASPSALVWYSVKTPVANNFTKVFILNNHQR